MGTTDIKKEEVKQTRKICKNVAEIPRKIKIVEFPIGFFAAMLSLERYTSAQIR